MPSDERKLEELVTGDKIWIVEIRDVLASSISRIASNHNRKLGSGAVSRPVVMEWLLPSFLEMAPKIRGSFRVGDPKKSGRGYKAGCARIVRRRINQHRSRWRHGQNEE